MSNSSKKQVSDEIRRVVSRYEHMLASGRKEYFDEDDLLDVADYYYNDMSRPDDATMCLDYVIKLHPDCTMAYLMKAEILYYQDKTSEAWKILRGLDDSGDSDVLYYCGLFSLEEGKYEEAAEYYRKAYFAQAGGGTEMFCQIVWDYLDHNITAGLDRWFALLPERQQHDLDVMEARAEYLRQKGDLTAAADIEEKLIAKDPYNVTYWNGLTKLHYQNADYASAKESVKYALDIDPDNTESLMLAAEIALEQEQWKKANEYYDRYIALEDRDALAYYNNARALSYMGRYNDAAVQLDYALKYSDKEHLTKADVLEQYALIYWKLGKPSMAKKILDKAHKEGLPETIYLLKLIHLNLETGNEKKMGEYVERVTQGIIRGEMPPNVLLYTLISYEKYDLAQRAIDEILQGLPVLEPLCLAFRAMIYFHSGDKQKFLDNLKRAVDEDEEVAHSILRPIFPESLDVKDYYDFAATHWA